MAAKQIQIRTCLKCARKTLQRVCPMCGGNAIPLWTVHDDLGNIRGVVDGASFQEALESARQSSKYDKLKAFTVREAYD